jgi:hypothetical protein
MQPLGTCRTLERGLLVTYPRRPRFAGTPLPPQPPKLNASPVGRSCQRARAGVQLLDIGYLPGCVCGAGRSVTCPHAGRTAVAEARGRGSTVGRSRQRRVAPSIRQRDGRPSCRVVLDVRVSADAGQWRRRDVAHCAAAASARSQRQIRAFVLAASPSATSGDVVPGPRRDPPQDGQAWSFAPA